MISIRFSTNDENKHLQAKLVVWMTKHKFTYNMVTHEWSSMMPLQFIDWNILFRIAQKFEAQIYINFNKVQNLGSIRA